MFKLFFFFLKLKNTKSKATKNSTLIVKNVKRNKNIYFTCMIKTPEAATSVYVSNACAVLLQSDSAIFSSHKEGNKSILCNILDNKANIFTIIFSFSEVFVFYKKEFLLSSGSRTCIWTGLYFVLIGG